MGTSLEDEKTSNAGDELRPANVPDVDAVPQTSRAQRWFKTTTEFLAHWGIETNGWVPHAEAPCDV